MLRVDVAGADYREGRALAVEGRHAESIAVLNRAIDELERAGAHSRPPGDIVQDMSAVLIWVGDESTRLGNLRAALESYDRATSMLEATRKASLLNQDAICELATGLNRTGEIAIRQGQLPEAAAAFERARTLVDTESALDRRDVPSLYAAAEALAGLADVSAALARTARAALNETTLHRNARDQIERSNRLRAAIPVRARITPIGLATPLFAGPVL
jgi:tetratricopeptide (TPR) repeat protein